MSNTLLVTGKGGDIGAILSTLSIEPQFYSRSSCNAIPTLLSTKYEARFHNVTKAEIDYIKRMVGNRAKFQLL